LTFREVYNGAKRRLTKAGIKSPAFDAACIFEKHSGLKRHDMPINGQKEADFNLEDLWRDVDRRTLGEPLQYILGEWEFMGLKFFVGPGVLVPRQDTELLCETALNFLKNRQNPKLLELCAGSGCSAIAVAKLLNNCEAICLELSPKAAEYLKKNIALHNVQNRVKLVMGDMLMFNANEWSDTFDAIICNPPYIPTADIGTLEREVREHEPLLALDGGPNGLLFYHAALKWLPLLKHGGMVVFEVGLGQAGDVAEILGDALADVFILRDLSGIERVVGGYCFND